MFCPLRYWQSSFWLSKLFIVKASFLKTGFFFSFYFYSVRFWFPFSSVSVCNAASSPHRPPSLLDLGQLGRLFAVRPRRGGRENVCENHSSAALTAHSLNCKWQGWGQRAEHHHRGHFSLRPKEESICQIGHAASIPVLTLRVCRLVLIKMTQFVPAPQLLLEHRRIQAEPAPVQVKTQ